MQGGGLGSERGWLEGEDKGGARSRNDWRDRCSGDIKVIRIGSIDGNRQTGEVGVPGVFDGEGPRGGGVHQDAAVGNRGTAIREARVRWLLDDDFYRLRGRDHRQTMSGSGGLSDAAELLSRQQHAGRKGGWCHPLVEGAVADSAFSIVTPADEAAVTAQGALVIPTRAVSHDGLARQGGGRADEHRDGLGTGIAVPGKKSPGDQGPIGAETGGFRSAGGDGFQGFALKRGAGTREHGPGQINGIGTRTDTQLAVGIAAPAHGGAVRAKGHAMAGARADLDGGAALQSSACHGHCHGHWAAARTAIAHLTARAFTPGNNGAIRAEGQ